MSENNLKPCPFCGSNNIDYSIKTCGSYRGQYHVAMYCKDCNCYGKRTLIEPTETARWEIEKNSQYKELAMQAWNTRKPIDNILEQLEMILDILEDEAIKDHSKFGEYYATTRAINIVKEWENEQY